MTQFRLCKVHYYKVCNSRHRDHSQRIQADRVCNTKRWKHLLCCCNIQHYMQCMLQMMLHQLLLNRCQLHMPHICRSLFRTCQLRTSNRKSLQLLELRLNSNQEHILCTMQNHSMGYRSQVRKPYKRQTMESRRLAQMFLLGKIHTLLHQYY